MKLGKFIFIDLNKALAIVLRAYYAPPSII